MPFPAALYRKYSLASFAAYRLLLAALIAGYLTFR